MERNSAQGPQNEIWWKAAFLSNLCGCLRKNGICRDWQVFFLFLTGLKFFLNQRLPLIVPLTSLVHDFTLLLDVMTTLYTTCYISLLLDMCACKLPPELCTCSQDSKLINSKVHSTSTDITSALMWNKLCYEKNYAVHKLYKGWVVCSIQHHIVKLQKDKCIKHAWRFKWCYGENT